MKFSKKEKQKSKEEQSTYQSIEAKGVSVVARFRPLNNKELNISQDQCVNFIDNQQVEMISTIESSKYRFNFDRIFDTSTCQKEVFEVSSKPIISSVLDGFNGTILAYGQTSSGKTYTMQGEIDNDEYEGVIPRTITFLFDSIINAPEEVEFTVKISMLEIYMEKIRDLLDLDKYNLNIREDRNKGIYIEDLSEYYVSSKEEVIELMKAGNSNRTFASTNMNEMSSRSHSIVIISLYQRNNKDLSAKFSKLVLVDLAGSEKISKTGATGLTLEEAKTINKSLTTLGMVINSLTDGKSQYVPYRDSKLTRVLQESLGGNSKTCLIITCSPSVYNEGESLSTLRFGNRAKSIKNKPKINKELTVGELQLVIEGLESKLTFANKRITQLENYIIKKGMALPESGYFTNEEIGNTNTEEVNRINISNSTVGTIRNINMGKSKNTQIAVSDITNTEVYKVLNNQLKEEQNKNKEQERKLDELMKILEENENLLSIYSDNIKNNETITKSTMLMLKAKNDNIQTYNKSSKPFSQTQTMQSSVQQIDIPQKESSTQQIEGKIEYSNMNFSKNQTQKIYKNKLELDEPDIAKDIENEKILILKSLEDKSERLAQLENEIKELNDTIKIYDNKINIEDRNWAKKVVLLERNIDTLNKMYQEVVTQKNMVKCENKILNKKVKLKNDSIFLLEKELNEVKESIKSKEEKNLRQTVKINNNVVKVIKGGVGVMCS